MENENLKYPQTTDFADLMHTRMVCNSYKDDVGWHGLSDAELLDRLKQNVADLEKRITCDSDWAHCTEPVINCWTSAITP